jgi:hypothetical protein
MASGESRTEVLDSEDEPMTSLPVDVSDGAADKLCAAAPVAPQDAQDALQEAARPHQANAENIAKSPTHRTGGLEAYPENASTNDVTPINTQPAGEATTSAEGRIVDVHHNEVTGSPETTSSQPDAQAATVASPDAVTTSTTSDGQRETDQAMTVERLDTTHPSTDINPSNPESTSHNSGAGTGYVAFPETAALAPAPCQAGSSMEELKPEEGSLAGMEDKHASTPGTFEEHLGQDDMGLINDESKPSAPSTPHNVDSTPEDSRLEASTSEYATSSTKHLTGTDYHQDANHDTDAQMTDDSSSQAPAQGDVNGHVAKQPVCLRFIPLLSARLHFHRLHTSRAKTLFRTARMKIWTWR